MTQNFGRVSRESSFNSQRFFTIAHNIGPTMSIVEVFLQLRWIQICAQGNSFTEHALRLLQIFSLEAKPKRK